MPWKESSVVEERMRFVVRLEQGERMTDLCREYGIARKTGYKVLNRYRKEGPAGLEDRSRRPHRFAHRTPEETEKLILDLKKKRPTWGARKLHSVLVKKHPKVKIPVISTIGEILKRHGLVKPRRYRRRTPQLPCSLSSSKQPNDIWCADFKGEFRMGNRKKCYPLTITDHFSRYIIDVEGLESTKGKPCHAVFERAFELYGLPRAIRTDNGTPFASRGLWGLTKLSAWWLRLGIELQRIEPGHPEQNGRHERMHLTLKEETCRPAAANILQQQEKFDRFITIFNEERPHESLEMETPSDVYCPSERAYAKPQMSSYPLHDQVRKVKPCGHINLGARGLNGYLSSSLADQYVGLREVDLNRWLCTYASLDVGHFIVESGKVTFEPLDLEYC